MKIQDRILQRKIGAFEVLLAGAVLELLFGSRPRAILLSLLAVGFYVAKREFKGEFSLLDVVGHFNKQNPNPNPETPKEPTK